MYLRDEDIQVLQLQSNTISVMILNAIEELRTERLDI